MIRLLVVDDESTIRNGLLRHVRWKECGVDEVLTAASAQAAIELCRGRRPDIVLSDIRMPGMNGLEMCAYLRTVLPDCRFILLSAYSDKEYLKAAIELSVVNYVEKPVDIPELERAVRRASEECLSRERLASIAQDEFLLARFMDALGKRERAALIGIMDELRAESHISGELAQRRKLYFRFGCQLANLLSQELTPAEREERMRAAVEARDSVDALDRWLRGEVDALLPGEDAPPCSPVIEAVKQHILERIASGQLSVQWLADQVYLTPTYLSALFKKETGITLSQYFMNVRIERAKKLLEDHRLRMPQIARRVGYSDAKHFAKVFKKELGITPTDYRRERVKS